MAAAFSESLSSEAINFASNFSGEFLSKKSNIFSPVVFFLSHDILLMWFILSFHLVIYFILLKRFSKQIFG